MFRRFFLFPAILFTVFAPAWGVAAQHAPDSFMKAEFLIIGLIQVGVAVGFNWLAFRD